MADFLSGDWLTGDFDVGGSSALPVIFQQVVHMNILDIVKKDSVDRSITLNIIDSTTGAPELGVLFNTAGIDLWYRREGGVVVPITEVTLATLTTAHTNGGFLEIANGAYRLDLPDAAFATGAIYVDVGGTVTGMIVLGGRVRLVDYNPEDAVRLGLTALPNAAADAAGGLPISDAGGLALDIVASDVTAIKKNAFVSTELAIGTVTSQTVLVLTGGPTNNIANLMAIIYDASDAAARVVAEGSYVGGTGTLTLTAATAITITTSDTVTLVAVAADTDAAAIRAAVGLASANLDTQLSTIDTVVDSILVDTGTTLQAELDGIQADTEDIQARLPAALVSGRIDASVGAMAANVLTATAIATDAITDAKVAADVTIASVTGAVGSVTGSVGSVVGGINTGTGVITTLDALDTAQDTQHGTTRTAIGTAGAGLTAIPWNAAWDAEVQSEVQDAIEVNHLDHLLAVDYDPATKPGVATALLNELIENDAGVARYTANALEQAPSGTGASAASIRAEIDANSTQLALIVADTNELQTDWANGGRLDLILDTTAAQATAAALDASKIPRKATAIAAGATATETRTVVTDTTTTLVETRGIS